MKLNNTTKRILFLFFGISFLSFSLSSGQAATVYVLRGGNTASDSAVISALREGGHDVTAGPETKDWNGTQTDLSNFDAVVVLHNFNYTQSMPLSGASALVQYICNVGGGIVTSEWQVWNVFQGRDIGLGALVPTAQLGFNSAGSTIYTQETPDETINEGLPESFTFGLGNIGGSETRFDPFARPDAIVFYTSSNGGGLAGSPGLIGWSVLSGKVISFSTLITNTELGSADYRRLLSNAVNWAARPAK